MTAVIEDRLPYVRLWQPVTGLTCPGCDSADVVYVAPLSETVGRFGCDTRDCAVGEWYAPHLAAWTAVDEDGPLPPDGPREARNGRDKTARAGLVALADYLTDLDDYPDPWLVFAAFCPGVPLGRVERWAVELLGICASGEIARADRQYYVATVLDYLTGVR